MSRSGSSADSSSSWAQIAFGSSTWLPRKTIRSLSNRLNTWSSRFIPLPAGVRSDGSGMNLDDQVFNRLLKERIVFLGSQVDDPIANAICAQLLLLSAEDPDRDIFLYINSPGGSVTAGMAIYDTMQYVENDVATVGLGLAASMGQFLLCAGAPGKRYALPHARIMMHQPSGGLGG